MWQLLDIAYVIPATVLIGWAASKYLMHGQHFTTSVLVAALCGFILAGYKIKNYIDKVNKESAAKFKSKTENNAK